MVWSKKHQRWLTKEEADKEKQMEKAFKRFSRTKNMTVEEGSDVVIITVNEDGDTVKR